MTRRQRTDRLVQRGGDVAAPIRRLAAVAVLLALPGLPGCERKTETTFEPEIGTVDNLRDITSPFLTLYSPTGSQEGPFNIASFVLEAFDPDGTNGKPASGIDLASVQVSLNGVNTVGTWSGNRYTVPVGLSFGYLDIQASIADLFGNPVTYTGSLNIDREPPRLDVVMQPAALLDATKPYRMISFVSDVFDPNLNSVNVGFYRPAGGSCAGANQLYGQGGGADSFDLHNWDFTPDQLTNGRIAISTRYYNAATSFGDVVTSTICLKLTAWDAVLNADGGAASNVSTYTYPFDIRSTFATGRIVGRVTRPDGSGIPGVDVLAVMPTGQAASAITDAFGIYEIDGVVGNDIGVVVTAPTDMVCEPSLVEVDVPPNTVATANFTCAPKPGSIRGRVTSSDGSPLVNVGVRLTFTDGADPDQLTYTNSQGAYDFDMVRPGPRNVRIQSGVPDGFDCDPDSKDVQLGPGEDATVDFTCTPPAVYGEVHARVIANGQPISGAVVRAGGQTAVTNSLGIAILTLVYGVYELDVVTAPAWATCSPQPFNLAVAVFSVVVSCAIAPFALQLSPSYRHFQNDSELCVAIAANNPLLAGVVFSLLVTGPGVAGSNSVQGVLDAEGAALARITIFAYGLYRFFLNVLGTSTSTEIEVTGAPGSCG